MLIYMFVKLMLRFANLVTSVLPEHTPITWTQDMAPLWSLLGFLGAFGQFVNLPMLIMVMTIILAFELGYWLYAAYRVLIGLIPTFR